MVGKNECLKNFCQDYYDLCLIVFEIYISEINYLLFIVDFKCLFLLCVTRIKASYLERIQGSKGVNCEVAECCRALNERFHDAHGGCTHIPSNNSIIGKTKYYSL